MKYRELQIGEILEAGDEFLEESGVWKRTKRIGCTYTGMEREFYLFYRRPINDVKVDELVI
jgi:hypothetical protein